MQDLHKYFCLFFLKVTFLFAQYRYDYKGSAGKPRCHKCETVWNTEQGEEKQMQENIDERPRSMYGILKGIFRRCVWKVQQPEG